MDRMNYDGPGYGCVGVTVGVRLGSDLRERWGGYTTEQEHIVWGGGEFPAAWQPAAPVARTRRFSFRVATLFLRRLSCVAQTATNGLIATQDKARFPRSPFVGN